MPELGIVGACRAGWAEPAPEQREGVPAAADQRGGRQAGRDPGGPGADEGGAGPRGAGRPPHPRRGL